MRASGVEVVVREAGVEAVVTVVSVPAGSCCLTTICVGSVADPLTLHVACGCIRSPMSTWGILTAISFLFG